MSNLSDDGVRAILESPNCAVISTVNPDGSIHSAVVWISLEDDVLAVNSARGRAWPNNLERDPRITVVVYPDGNPYDYVEIRGTASGSLDDADDHIDRLARRYTGAESFARASPDEVRIKYTIAPRRVRHYG